MQTKANHWNNYLINPRYRICRYLGLIIFLFAIIFNIYIADYGTSIGTALCLVISIIFLIFYLSAILFNLKILIPKLLLRNRNLPYLFSLFITIKFVTLIQQLSSSLISDIYHIKPQEFHSLFERNLYVLVLFFINTFFFTGISVTVFLQRLIIDSQEIDRLEKECLLSELQDLKKKIQPDFLFNMLNKANVFAIKKPEIASDILLKLSHILRYQLYDSEREKVLLTSDIAFINDYLALERIRANHFDFSIAKQGKMNGVLVPALLFLPIINGVIEYLYTNESCHFRSTICIKYNCNKQLNFICTITSDANSISSFDIESEYLYRRIVLLYGNESVISTKTDISGYTIDITVPLK